MALQPTADLTDFTLRYALLKGGKEQTTSHQAQLVKTHFLVDTFKQILMKNQLFFGSFSKNYLLLKPAKLWVLVVSWLVNDLFSNHSVKKMKLFCDLSLLYHNCFSLLLSVFHTRLAWNYSFLNGSDHCSKRNWRRLKKREAVKYAFFDSKFLVGLLHMKRRFLVAFSLFIYEVLSTFSVWQLLN